MSLQRRKKRCQSEAEEKKVNKQGRKKGRRDVCALIWVALRRNRRIAFKGFLIISYSLMRFLSQENQKGMTPAKSCASMTKFSFYLKAQVTVTFTT